MQSKTLKIEVLDKKTIAKNIARQMGMTIADVSRMIDIFEAEIEDAIKNNKKVQLNGFLIFTPKNVEEKTIVSALDKKEYVVEAKRTVEVRVGKDFKEFIKKGYSGKDESNDTTSKSGRPKKRK